MPVIGHSSSVGNECHHVSQKGLSFVLFVIAANATLPSNDTMMMQSKTMATACDGNTSSRCHSQGLLFPSNDALLVSTPHSRFE